MKIDHQQPSALEDLQQRDRSMRVNKRDGGAYLHHWQTPAGRCDRITLAGVRLLPNPQRIQFGLPGGSVDSSGEAR